MPVALLLVGLKARFLRETMTHTNTQQIPQAEQAAKQNQQTKNVTGREGKNQECSLYLGGFVLVSVPQATNIAKTRAFFTVFPSHILAKAFCNPLALFSVFDIRLYHL